jgi:hypothetical protein
MRLTAAAFLALLALAGPALAQPAGAPPALEPLPPPPPPTPGFDMDPALEPQVTIRKDGENTVSEYRIKGKLYMMKVTPAHGRPYVLIDHKGDGQFARQDNLDSGLRVPQWVLLEF